MKKILMPVDGAYLLGKGRFRIEHNKFASHMRLELVLTRWRRIEWYLGEESDYLDNI